MQGCHEADFKDYCDDAVNIVFKTENNALKKDLAAKEKDSAAKEMRLKKILLQKEKKHEQEKAAMKKQGKQEKERAVTQALTEQELAQKQEMLMEYKRKEEEQKTWGILTWTVEKLAIMAKCVGRPELANGIAAIAGG